MNAKKWSILIFSIAMLYAIINFLINYNSTWTITDGPILIVYIAFFVSVILSYKGGSPVGWLRKIGTYLMRTFSILFIIIFSLYFCFKLFLMTFGGIAHVADTTSPDGKYKIEFNSFDAGAAGTFGISGTIKGYFGFEKLFYYEVHGTEVEIEWPSNDTIIVNGHELNLAKDELFGFHRNNK